MPVISALSPVSLSSYFDPNTGAVMQVDLYFYAGGTLDPLPVYADALLSVPHPVPLPSTGYGRVPPVFIGELPEPGYRVRVFDQYSQLVEDLDNLPGAVVPEGGGGGGGPVEPDDVHLLKTGDYVFCGRNSTPRDGAVLCNGLTLGSATSSATGRANADAHDLFVFLWGADEFNMLPVLPSRGVSAEGDWLANKAITLPDFRGMTIVGVDGMGSTEVNRLANVPMTAGLQDQVFARGGSALVTLTNAMTPTHNHAITDAGHTHGATIPAHSHSFINGVAAANGSHAHTGTTSVNGAHQHTYSAGGPFGIVDGAGTLRTVSEPPADRLTLSAGDHNHTFATSTDGLHVHGVTGDITTGPAVGITTANGTTGISLATAGEGGAHNNTPLFVTVAVYMVL